MSNFVLDVKNINTRDDFHNLVKDVFSLPSYYGKNLDALWDLLTEMEDLNILIMNANKLKEKLGEYGTSVLELFSDLEEIEGNKVKYIYSGCHIEDENFSSKSKNSPVKRDGVKSIYGKHPQIDDTAVVLEGAKVVGDVVLSKDVSIWYNATLRADYNKIFIGENSNIQDNAVVHLSHDSEAIIGSNVTVGHSAIVHGAKIEDNVIIGMGSIILDNAVIGKNSIVGAGSLVTKGKIIPEDSLVLGSPAKVIRELTKEEIASIKMNAHDYVQNSKKQI